MNEFELTSRRRLDELEAARGRSLKQPLRIFAAKRFYSHYLFYIDKR